MNLRNIGIIIRREYLNKVKKKSFLIITFVVPVLFALLCVVPSLIMLYTKEAAKDVAVVDNSGIVLPYLVDNENIKYKDFSTMPLDTVKAYMQKFEVDAVLGISPIDSAAKTVMAEIFSEKPLGLETTENINHRIDEAVEAYRVESYGIAGLSDIMKDVKAHVRVKSYTMDASGKETVSESGVYMAVSMILGMIIYMFVALFCGMVMSSVIEEKSSRVVEVLISSVKATELMFGKIIGVALVAMTQFLLWIVLGGVIVTGATALLGDKLDLSAMAADPMTTSMIESSGVDLASGEISELGTILGTLGNLPVGTILISFVLFFIFGYLLYASLFAAIGSAVENEADSQQLQIPVTIPMLVGFLIAFSAYKAPDSAVVFWGSMIPFTSPIVMLARIPFGIPTWQLVVSLAVLILTFAICAYISAKIYKVGILMFGKKTSFKDLWKWLKQD